LPEFSVAAPSQNLPQLYRFCYLMTGEEEKAQAAFQDTIREAAARSAEGEAANDRVWFFREARWRCLAASAQGLQAEAVTMDEAEVSADAPEQLEQLDVQQLAIWIAGALEPQRSALALYYLDEFNHRELVAILEIKVTELGELIARGRRQFQAWLDAVIHL
jgi:DNA-directed RNA polymerase specialized sigma24 family protein